MTTTLIEGVPVLAWVAALAGILVLIALFRLLRFRRDEADNLFRIEPDLDSRAERFEDRQRSAGLGAGPRLPPRRRGFASVVITFAAGLVFGVFGVPLALRHAAPIGTAITGIGEALTEASDAVDPVKVASVGGSDEAAPAPPVGRTLALFVSTLAQELPKQIDASTTLVAADVKGSVVTLGHRVSETLSDADSATFAEAAKDHVIGGVCAGDAGAAIRGFSHNGVEFRFIFADPAGKTIAAITLEPDFCARQSVE